MRRLALAAIACAVVAVACGSSGAAPSSGAGDDGGAPGPSGDDAGGDASALDASGGEAAAPIVPSAPCTDAIADVYVTPAGLPAMTDAARGDVVRCAADGAIDASAMASRLQASGVTGVPVASAAHAWRIAYRTKRGTGADGVATARVYLPDAPRSTLPVLAAAHPTIGLADVCAPSKNPTVVDYYELPFVAHGYALIATDDAGLGNEGTPGYEDQIDTAQSTLDAARALRKLVGATAFDPRVIVLGHSEGGGAALSAQALAKSYGDGDVAAAIAFAPGWPIGVDVSGFRDTTVQTNVGGGYFAAFSAMGIDAYFANHVGASHEGDGFGAGARAQLVSDLGSQCILQLGTSVPQAAPTVGDLVDATFRQTLLDCYDAKATCAEPGKSYLAYLTANVLHADPQGGKVLVVQGLNDVVVAPSLTACTVKKLGADGVTPTVCTDGTAGHLDVVQRQAAFALSWVDALVAGAAPPTCTATGLPTCP